MLYVNYLINPFTEEQPNSLGTVLKQFFQHFNARNPQNLNKFAILVNLMFCLRCKTIRLQAARRLVVLHLD